MRKTIAIIWKQPQQGVIRVNGGTIENMIKAGLIRLDLISYGIEPDKPVAACVGKYSPIGSESAPIIQVFDTMGWHKLAKRCLQFFIEKQHENGFMQNFDNYMLETGAVLWTMGQHFSIIKIHPG
ncbi:MAG TPA: hypothetical protein PK303_05600 [bacterium]|mgnify:CR=1 FL=1|nr:hypothetical protein [bacterium]HOL34885.1 hypothetical protein [bacterium]HPP08573.1 hypothetical protein [bacterium]